jgi:hypothetical protein
MAHERSRIELVRRIRFGRRPFGKGCPFDSAFWLTVAAGTFPSHLSPSMERIDGRPELPDLVTRELEMSNPDLLRLFKLQ